MISRLWVTSISTRAAMTVSISDMTVPAAKKQILADAEKTVDKITKHYRQRFLNRRGKI